MHGPDLAVLVDFDACERERAHITTLCVQHGVNGPPDGAAQSSVALGAMHFTGERHGEFSTYAVFISGCMSCRRGWSPRFVCRPRASAHHGASALEQGTQGSHHGCTVSMTIRSPSVPVFTFAT